MNIIGEVSQVLTLHYPVVPDGQLLEPCDVNRIRELNEAASLLLDESLTAGTYRDAGPRDIVIGNLAVLKNVKFVTHVHSTETEIKATFVQYLVTP